MAIGMITDESIGPITSKITTTEAQTMSRFAERFREEGIQQSIQLGMQ